MKCPKCKNLDTRVVDSRITEDGKAIRRRRAREKCEHRFTTFERLEFVSFFVKKNNGEKELYDRSKLEKNILIAFNKRNISLGKIDAILNDLENEWASNKKEISSKRIGRDVLYKIKDIDEIAYIRFASVYKQFENAQDFVDFIKEEFI